jgi:hypothetical protein
VANASASSIAASGLDCDATATTVLPEPRPADARHDPLQRWLGGATVATTPTGSGTVKLK